MENPKDLLGQPITKGCLIAYANLIGRSANQCIYEVVDIVDHEAVKYDYDYTTNTPTKVPYTAFKLKAKPLDRSHWYTRTKLVTLAMMERAIVLPESYREILAT